MLQVIEQSTEEKMKMYLKCTKKELATMLISSNDNLEAAIKNCNLPYVTIPVKIIGPIEITWFKNIVELNNWFGDGNYCEIIAINYDNREGVHYVHYRLK